MSKSASENTSVRKKDSKACQLKKHPFSISNFGGYAEEPDVILNTHNHSKTLWSYYFFGDVKIPEICIDSLTNQCPKEKEGCSRLHANKPWHWQLLYKNKWYNFIHTQSDVIERAFQKADAVDIVIPPLNPSKTGKIGQGLLPIVGTDSWKADFNTMKISRVGFHDSRMIRRLATPSSAKLKSKVSTDYTWFIQQEHEWVELDQYFEGLDDSFQECLSIRSETVSSEVEYKFQQNQRASMVLRLLNYEFIISFSKMKCQSQFSNETLPVRRRPKNCNVPYPTVWSRYIQDSNIAEICTDRAYETCLTSGECERVHSENTWRWEVLHSGIWYSLPKLQSQVLERSYIDMWHDSVKIPELNPAKMGKSGEIMAAVLGTSKWLAKFDSETLTKLNRQDTTLKMRRLSPASTNTSYFRNPSRFVWFYKNSENIWFEFGYDDIKSDTSDLHPQMVSDQIEKVFLSNKENAMEVTLMDNTFKLCFSSMTLSNCKTQKVMSVRRRPQHARSNNISARALNIIPLSDASEEHVEIKTSLLSSFSERKIKNIKRFQNPDLRRVFGKRQLEVSALLGKQNVDILTLFHWVKTAYVENVHSENFRHKHQCPEVNKISGKGVCFYKSAEFQHKSCSPVPLAKNHRLLLFEVIISKSKDANERTSSTSTPVEEGNTPEVYYVCDKRDYCPAYVIEF